ncbi:MAG: S9 family peptidase [Gammaproteobacteria bacterium]|nr:S9 family peptidase [Gammaproteobacteria bacterium]
MLLRPIRYYPLFFFTWLILFQSIGFSNEIDYPLSKISNVQDNYHGNIIDDPYRWLEDLNSLETSEWIQSQNKFTDEYLNGYKEINLFKEILSKAYKNETRSVPFRVKSKHFYYVNNGDWQQSKLFYENNSESERKLLLDPNILSEDGTVAISSVSVSPNADLVAYSLSDGGSDWRTWKIKNIKTGETLKDLIRWSKFSNAEWKKDNSGFFYSRYDEPKKGDEFESINTNQKLFFHRIGQSQTKDELIYQRMDRPEWGWGTTVTEDGNFLILHVSEGTDERNRVFYQSIEGNNNKIIELIPDLKAQFSFIGNNKSIFWFFTDLDAPMGRVIAIDINKPDEDNWLELIPENKNTLIDVREIKDFLIGQYLNNVSSEIVLFEKKTFSKSYMQFNDEGIFSSLSTEVDSNIFYFLYTNYVKPNQIYQYNAFDNNLKTIWIKNVPGFKSDQYISKKVFYPSKDGTQIPMFISYKKDQTIDSDTPLLLYGYGGFDISILPSFSERYFAWMKMGGIVAVPNLRGGGEYGELWHQQGMLENKQNVFDDFAAAAEYLHKNNYSKPKKTVISGRSNGGLLVGATFLQSPTLFGATLPAVGVMDMLRFNKFTIGWAWESDYGSPENIDGFSALIKYSPYHNIARDVCYPPALITTSEIDDRVVPSHSYKFAARLQEAQECNNPILIRIETRAGHGAGTPKNKTIDYIADSYGFALHHLLKN